MGTGFGGDDQCQRRPALAHITGAWVRIEAIVRNAKSDAVQAVTTASAKADIVASARSEHRLHVAETYVSKAGLREQAAQIMEALNGVQGSLDRPNERLDRVIEGQPQRRHPGARSPQ